MNIVRATPTDVESATACLVRAFASDPVTGFFFLSAQNRRQELRSEFFSLLLLARLQMNMPVLLVRKGGPVHGVAMGYSTERPEWPPDLSDAWERMEHSVPGMTERVSVYETISRQGKPRVPHYYLGVIGVDPRIQGRGVGARLLRAFCTISVADSSSSGVYLETATPENVPFYEREGFAVSHVGALGDGNLWCMYLQHARPAA